MYVYFIRSNSKPPMVKIGRSDDPAHRMAELQVGCPFELEMFGTVKCKSLAHSIEIEKTAHEVFRKLAYRGEWFRFTHDSQRWIESVLRGDADSVRHSVHESRVDQWIDRQRKRDAYRFCKKGLQEGHK